MKNPGKSGKKREQRVLLPFFAAPRRPCGLVITCTKTARWVASAWLHRFQLPAAEGSREACEPRSESSVPYNEMWVKKRPSRTGQGAPPRGRSAERLCRPAVSIYHSFGKNAIGKRTITPPLPPPPGRRPGTPGRPPRRRRRTPASAPRRPRR